VASAWLSTGIVRTMVPGSCPKLICSHKMTSQVASLALLAFVGIPALAQPGAGNLRGGAVDRDIANVTSKNLTDADVMLKASSYATMIKWVHDPSFCLSVDNNNANNGVKMQLWKCAGGAGQYFNAPAPHHTDYLKLHMNSYFCVVVDNNANYNGAQAQVWGPCTQWNQKWRLGGDGYDGMHSIEWTTGGKCLVVDGNRAYNGARVQIWDCHSVQQNYRDWFV